MHKGRLEAFSDAVIAIIITIMVLELKIPHGAELNDLTPLAPVFISYILSFIFLGIYWNNHHHLMQMAQKVTGGILWANSHLLFWLSLIPFTTAWMGEHEFAQWPVALYGFNLLMCGTAYYILSQALVRFHGNQSLLAQAMGREMKELISMVVYAVSIGLAFVHPFLAYLGYISVAVLWICPDQRVERLLTRKME